MGDQKGFKEREFIFNGVGGTPSGRIDLWRALCEIMTKCKTLSKQKC